VVDRRLEGYAEGDAHGYEPELYAKTVIKMGLERWPEVAIGMIRVGTVNDRR
jgi:hypothetical protein